MNTAGSHELGYASSAIGAALLDHLVTRKIISPQDAGAILDDATAALRSLGNLTHIPGAIRVIGDVKAQLAKHGVR